jgi:hypothetical protein
VDWNNDTLNDLLIGDAIGNIHLYLNTNSNLHPALDDGRLIKGYNIKTRTYENLNVGLRAAPEVHDWDGDGRKDLVIGNYDGNILIYINSGTDDAPVFQSPPVYVKLHDKRFQVSEGGRAAPRMFDWDNDGPKDLLVGAYEGHIYFLKNVGADKKPMFQKSVQLTLYNNLPLRFPDEDGSPRSRFSITDWNNDGMYDLLIGGKDGRVILYAALR